MSRLRRSRDRRTGRGPFPHRLPAHRDDGVLFPELPADKLVRDEDPEHFLYDRQSLERVRIEIPLVADRPDDRALHPARDVRGQPLPLDRVLDLPDVLFRGAGAKYDDHAVPLFARRPRVRPRILMYWARSFRSSSAWATGGRRGDPTCRGRRGTPRLRLDRTRLDLGQVHVVLRERLQHQVERTDLVPAGEEDRGLVVPVGTDACFRG